MSVLLRYTDFDYPLGIFKLFLKYTIDTEQISTMFSFLCSVYSGVIAAQYLVFCVVFVVVLLLLSV